MRKHYFITVVTLTILVFSFSLSFAQEMKPVKLPPPRTEGGKPLMETLKERQTNRLFNSRPLPAQVLSDLLWAAFGINRSEDGKRTAPSARNWQETDIYVLKEDGVFIYDAKAHTLQPVLGEDIRAAAGTQDFVKDAPLNLVYVADLSKMGSAPDDQKEKTAFADTGFIGQNVYLFCASEGLSVVIRGLIDRPPLAELLKLRPDQRITLAQTVGYPQ